MPRDSNVIVVGASICGLASALVLAKRGYRTRVLEKRLDPQADAGRRLLAASALETDQANRARRRGDFGSANRRFRQAGELRSQVWGSRNRNLLFDCHSLRFLRNLGIDTEGLPGLRALDTHLGPAQPSVCIHYGQHASELGSGRLDAPTMIAQRDPVAVPTIAAVERLLREAAEADPNVEIVFGSCVNSVCSSAEAVTVTYGAGSVATAVADLLVLADGAGRQSVSRSLGFQRIEIGSEQMNIAAFECDPGDTLLGHRLDEAWLDARTTPRGWVVFLNNGSGLLTVNTRCVIGVDCPSALQLALAAGIDYPLVEMPADFVYPLDRTAEFIYGPRAVIVGDAACRASPAWAFGAQFALLWAQMVADLCPADADLTGLPDPEALEAFRADAEQVANMRLEYERSAIGIVDQANAGVRESSGVAMSTSFLSALDKLDLNFEARGPHGGDLRLRVGVDLRRLLAAGDRPSLGAFCDAVGRLDMEGFLDLRFDSSGHGESVPSPQSPIQYRTNLESIRFRDGTVSMGRNGQGYWSIAMDGVAMDRTVFASRSTSVTSIESAELRLPDEYVTELLKQMGPRLWALGAARQRPLCFEVALKPGLLKIGAFGLRLDGSPVARVTVGPERDVSRFRFELVRGTARADRFSRFVRQTPVSAMRPLRLWQQMVGGIADPFVDFWAASASQLVRTVDFEVFARGNAHATYNVAGFPVRISMSRRDVEALISRLFSSESCEAIMRQYQQAVSAARIRPIAGVSP